ncbi:Cytochrome P450 family protein [Rutstroemia sp. NJR-2017a BBW]|nr:Cytochrome P450 family protein [Rutstroemia sp. NJR-2017a BBW]
MTGICGGMMSENSNPKDTSGGKRARNSLHSWVDLASVLLSSKLTRQFSKIVNRDPVLEYVEMVRMTTESRNGVKIALFA